MKFEQLINSIEAVHYELQRQTIRQANNSLTIRNLLIGFYVVEFEQKGEERAEYGEGLLKKISINLKSKGLKGFSDRNLRQFRQFYLTYPEIWQTVSAKLENLIPAIGRVLSNQSPITLKTDIPAIEPELLLSNLSFSHFIELIRAVLKML